MINVTITDCQKEWLTQLLFELHEENQAVFCFVICCTIYNTKCRKENKIEKLFE